MRARGLVVILYVFVAVAMLSFMTSFVEKSNKILDQREAILQLQEENRRQGEAMMRAQWNYSQP